MNDPVQFSLDSFTRVTVTNFNPRSELHGTEHVPAADIAFKLTASNTILDSIVPGLRSMLYKAVDEEDGEEQPELDGVDPVSDTPLLRCEDLEPLRLKKKYEGWTLEFDYGRGEKANIVLGGCTVDKFIVDGKQGGSVDLTFRAQASNLKSDAMGKLAVMIGLEQSIKLKAPVIAAVIDGTVGHPGAAKPDVTELFAAGTAIEKTLEERVAAGEPAWPFPTGNGASGEAPPQSVTVEQSQPGTRTARGREKTAKALASGAAG